GRGPDHGPAGHRHGAAAPRRWRDVARLPARRSLGRCPGTPARRRPGRGASRDGRSARAGQVPMSSSEEGRVPGPAPGRGERHTTPQRVLVTGAASGLGAALASAYRARGAMVLATDLADGVDLRLDITSDDEWVAARTWVEEHWGGLDVLVNNAGVAGGGRIDVAGLDEWEWITEINLFGV